MEKTIQSVGKKKLNKILDMIKQSNGIGRREICDQLKTSYTTIYYAIIHLMRMNCISEGVEIVRTKNGNETFRPAYYYESDF